MPDDPEVRRLKKLYEAARRELRWWNRREWEECCDHIGVARRLKEFDRWTQRELEGGKK